GHVMQQGGGEKDLPFLLGKRAPGRQRRQGFAHQPRVDPDVALGVVDGVLRAAGEVADAGIRRVARFPVQLPGGRLGARGKRDVHAGPPKRSTPSRSWFGTMVRFSQWLPESSTAVRKLARTYL